MKAAQRGLSVDRQPLENASPAGASASGEYLEAREHSVARDYSATCNYLVGPQYPAAREYLIVLADLVGRQYLVGR